VPAQARTIDVKPGTGTLQRAVDRAGDGDVLRLRSGVYHGGVVVEKSLTIRGPREGQRALVNGRCREAFTILVLDGEVTLSHLGVTGAADAVAGQYGAAEINYTDEGRGQARHLKVRESCDGTLYGINVFDTGDVTVRDSVLSGYRDAAVYVGGIRDPHHSVTVRRNVTKTNNRGVLVEDSLAPPHIRVSGNTMPRNDDGPMSAGVYILNSDGVLIQANVIQGSGYAGVWLDGNSDSNVLHTNTALSSGTADLQNDGDGNCGSDNTFGTQAGAPLVPC
jgi:parallel beta-helix repeat protein